MILILIFIMINIYYHSPTRILFIVHQKIEIEKSS